MDKDELYNALYMDIAIRASLMSHATRLKVGAVIVKNDSPISIGWNGMPKGMENNCEYNLHGMTVTKDEVLHAESNALTKLARSTLSCQDAILYVTHSTCLECAKLVHQAGISKVFYKHAYRSPDGINLLTKLGHTVVQL